MSTYSSTNKDRADRVRPFVESYHQLMGGMLSDDEVLVDLVTDLLHLADRTDEINAGSLIERAAYHHAEEAEEER